MSAVTVDATNRVLHAIDVDDGTTRWTFRAHARILSSPAVSGDERAVVFGADGEVYAVRADDGVLLWRIFVGGEVTGSPTLVGDRVYVPSKRGALEALVTHE